MKYFYLILLVVGLSVSYDNALAASHNSEKSSESELNWVIKKIKEKEATLKTFTATFKQTKASELLRDPLYSEGVVYFDINGSVLMKILSPLPLILLWKDNRQVIYYPDLSKVEQKSLGKKGDIFRQYLGIGESIKSLKAKFKIERIINPSAERYHLKMTPKQSDMAKHIVEIEVVVNSNHWLPEQIHFKGKKQDYTTIQLKYTSINEPIPSDIFEIEIPEDTEGNNRIR